MVDLHSDRGVIVLEVRVVVLDVGVRGEAAVFTGEVDLRAPEIARVAKGCLAFGASDGVSGFDCGTGHELVGDVRSAEATGNGGTLSAAVSTPWAGRPMRRARWAWSATVSSSARSLRAICAAVRREVVRSIERVLAVVESLLNDGDKTVGKALLFMKGSFALDVAVQREVSNCSVLCHRSTGVLEGESSGI